MKRNDLGLPRPDDIGIAREVEHLLRRALVDSLPVKDLARLIGFGEISIRVAEGLPVYVTVARRERVVGVGDKGKT